MGERYCAWIRIGGTIERTKTEPLLTEIRSSCVKLDWCQPCFEPTSVDELLAARTDGWLRLCDEEARYGEFKELEQVCQEIGLSYTRHTEAWCGEDATLLDFRPGMKEPVEQYGSNAGGDTVMVPADAVKEAIVLLRAGRVPEAIGKLEHLCPHIPQLPPFEIV